MVEISRALKVDLSLACKLKEAKQIQKIQVIN
jgi:hypothetical protein